MKIEKTLPLYLGSSVIGSVICREEERRITLHAKTYATLHGICRAYVKGQSGNLLIGVLAPDNVGFSANRTVSRTALADSGLDFEEITYAYALCPEKKNDATAGTWMQLDSIPEILHKDSAVLALAGSSDVLCDSNFAPTRIAVPLLTGRPFPRPDLLCLLTPGEIDGVLYGILGISKNGTPRRF